MKELEPTIAHSLAGPEPDEASVAQYLVVVWRFRLVVVLAAVLGGLAAFVFSWLSVPVYEAAARLMAPVVKGEESSTSAAGYALILNNQSLVEATLQELGMSGPPHRLAAAQFIARNFSIAALPDGNILVLRTRFSDPQLAARFANRIAERAVSLAREIREGDSVRRRDSLQAQLEDARAHLDAAEKSLQTARRESRLDILSADVDSVLEQRRQLLPLRLELRAERAELKKAEAELARQEPTRPFRRSTESTARPGSADRTASEESTAGRQQQLRDEVLSPFANPVYELLAQQVAYGRTRVASLEERLAGLEADGANRNLLATFYARRAEVERLQTEFTIARGVYETASTRYHEARLLAAGVPASLRVVDRAVVPTTPVAPRTVRNVAFGALFGAALAAVAALVIGSSSVTRGKARARAAI